MSLPDTPFAPMSNAIAVASHRSGLRTRGTLGIATALAGFAALLMAACFALRIHQGIWSHAFGDESEHLLGAQMLAAGGVLYRTYIDAHGPVVFMLTQLYGALFGWAHPNWARLISAVLASAAGAAIVSAPFLPGRVARFAAATLYFGLTATVWLPQALYMVNYHPIAGWLLLIGLAWFVVPAWLGSHVSGPAALFSGACFALTACVAYSLVPSVLLLGLSGMLSARGRALPFIAGGAAGALGVLAWLLRFGDLTGLAAFHFAANQFFYAKYIGFGPGNFFRSLVPSARPEAIVHDVALLCCAWAFLVLVAVGKFSRGRLLSVVMGFAGVLLLDARGLTGFQDGTFLVASIGLAAMATGSLPLVATAWRSGAALGCALGALAFCAGAEFVVRTEAVSSPGGLTHRQFRAMAPADLGLQYGPMFEKVRALVRRDERILALVYDPGFYLAAGRLPMDKYYEYLPWDADYAKAPWFGRGHDLCADLQKLPPPLVYFDNWTVWGRYRPSDYMPCVLNILARDYVRQTDFPTLYVRKDRAPAAR